MNITTSVRNALEIIEVIIAENVFRFSSFGGQIIGWEKSGIPLIFENKEAAITDGKTAYRGGIPFAFPHFGKGQLMPNHSIVEPQHGQARKTVWDWKQDPRGSTVVFTTVQPSSAGYPVTTFQLEISYILSNDIVIEAKITNTGKEASPFQFLVHTYWETEDLSITLVKGLGNHYLDNLQNLAVKEEPIDLDGKPKIFEAPVDSIYTNPLTAIQVKTPRFVIDITNENFNSVVVWNPGKDHGLKDLKSPDFLCVESGIITPAPTLAVGQSITARVSYKAQIL